MAGGRLARVFVFIILNYQQVTISHMDKEGKHFLGGTKRHKLLRASHSEEADALYSCETDAVQDRFHIAVHYSGISRDIDLVFGACTKAAADLVRQFVGRNSMSAEIEPTVACDSHVHGVFANGSGHPRGMFSSGQVNRDPWTDVSQEVGHEDEGQHEENTCMSGEVDSAEILRASLAYSFDAVSARRPDFGTVARESLNDFR